VSSVNWWVWGAVLGALAVGAGAFGAHALEGSRWEDDLPTFETAVRYQMYHALAILAVGFLHGIVKESRAVNVAGWAFTIGVALFSGGLYLWIFTDARPFVMVVPVGGTSLIVGWVAMAIAARGVPR